MQKAPVAKLNQMTPLSDQSSRSSIHIETNVKTTRIVPRKTSSRAETLNISMGCTRVMSSDLFVPGRRRRAFRLSVALRFTGFLGLRDFIISYPRQVLLFYDFALWRQLLIRDNQLAVGVLVNVMFFRPGFV